MIHLLDSHIQNINNRQIHFRQGILEEIDNNMKLALEEIKKYDKHKALDLLIINTEFNSMYFTDKEYDLGLVELVTTLEKYIKGLEKLKIVKISFLYTYDKGMINLRYTSV